MILLSSAESRELDRLSQEKYGIPSYSLMTRAGESVADAMMRVFAEAAAGGVLAFAGKGNNGGDAFVAARKLHQNGVIVRTLLLGSAADLKGDAQRAHNDYLAAGGQVIAITSEADLDVVLKYPPGVVIDGIFGTGLNSEVHGLARAAIERINQLEAPAVAVDIASGVDSDTGAIMGVAVEATMTVTFGYAKVGHMSFPGAGHCGELRIFDIGFAPKAIDEVAPRARFVVADEARRFVEPRPTNSHKGMYGHPMVIAASLGKSGAALLASRGALRTGAGLVTAAVPACVQSIVAAGQAELMTEPIADRDGHFDGERAGAALSTLLAGKDALIVGPGIGLNADTQRLMEWIITEASDPKLSILIDADGLNALAQLGCDRLKSARGAFVLTPHPGEAARLLGISTAEINANRVDAARRLSERTGASVLLKGARSVIAGAGGELFINSTGNPGMSTPGMGDALSGIVGALMARHLSPLDALVFGVFLHGYAADRVAERMGQVGYLAGDLIEELPAALQALSS
jgi:ADP-dependent NAD(P)H-hydrate dehydratase / NAD(P)H-hydrate epimerase